MNLLLLCIMNVSNNGFYFFLCAELLIQSTIQPYMPYILMYKSISCVSRDVLLGAYKGHYAFYRSISRP